MTFLEKYRHLKKWYEKACLMEMFHLTKKHQNPKWKIEETAHYFQVSIGLVSENLKLARLAHDDGEILKIPTREEALKKIKCLPVDAPN